MPYIVTTKRPCEKCEGDAGELRWEDGQVVGFDRCNAGCDEDGNVVVSRRAVATLEEARTGAERVAIDRGGSEAQQLWAKLGVESGGTVGPLSDGTVIVVERVGWAPLTVETGLGHYSNSQDEAKLIDAYNATQQERA